MRAGLGAIVVIAMVRSSIALFDTGSVWRSRATALSVRVSAARVLGGLLLLGAILLAVWTIGQIGPHGACDLGCD